MKSAIAGLVVVVLLGLVGVTALAVNSASVPAIRVAGDIPPDGNPPSP